MIRVVGIDPGSHKTGWGIVDGEGTRLTHVASGIVTGDGEGLASRLCSIAEGLEKVLREYQPQAASVETIFHARNSASALALGQARGVAVLIAARAGVSVHEYTAGQIKQSVTGRGRAEKEQVQMMVSAVLGLKANTAFASYDASDALAAAICHAQMFSTPASTFLQEAMREVRRGRRAKTGAPT